MWWAMPFSTQAQANASPAEQQLFAATNQARSAEGLAPLAWDVSLAYAAHAHAELMVQQQQLSHQLPGEADLTLRAAQAGAHFQSVAENIAMGPDAGAIQKQWMKSLPHRTNILDPKMNAIGFAVVEKNGYLYAVADFARAVPGMSLDQVEQAVARTLEAQGIKTTGPKQDARQTCEMPGGVAGNSHPGFVVRWQSSDPTKLPEPLEQRMHSGQFHTAAVGSCAPANSGQGFTSYRLAVLLY